MLEQRLHRIYTDLKRGARVDITPFCKEEYKEYVEKRKVVWGLCSSEPLDLRGEAASEKCSNWQYSQH